MENQTPLDWTIKQATTRQAACANFGIIASAIISVYPDKMPAQAIDRLRAYSAVLGLRLVELDR